MNLLPRRLLILSALVFLTACASMSPPQPPSLELPKPPTDLRAVRKGDRVLLTWTVPTTTTDRQTVRSIGPTRICRGLAATLTQCGAAVGETTVRPSTAKGKASKQKTSGSYSDPLPSELEIADPAALITFAIEVGNANGRGAGLSNQVRVSLIHTEPPPPDFRAKVTKDGVELRWSRNVSRVTWRAPVHYAYRIYRRQEGQAQWNLVGEFPAGGENDTAVTDSSIEWEKTYEYRIETVTVIEQSGSQEEIEGDDSPLVQVFADDVFPPAVPAGLQAVFSGPGQQLFIDLVWAPVTDLDLDGYNVYRHEEGMPAVKINSQLLKTPAYRDTDVVAGKGYFYSVSAMDVRGNESARSEEASERVP